METTTSIQGAFRASARSHDSGASVGLCELGKPHYSARVSFPGFKTVAAAEGFADAINAALDAHTKEPLTPYECSLALAEHWPDLFRDGDEMRIGWEFDDAGDPSVIFTRVYGRDGKPLVIPSWLDHRLIGSEPGQRALDESRMDACVAEQEAHDLMAGE